MEITSGTTEDGQWIREQLIAYNRQHVPAALYTEAEQYCFLAWNEDEELLGGVTASYVWNHLQVHFLWVDPENRIGGTGKQLMVKIESIAEEKSCSKILLDTFSFQAPGFYEKLGFEEYGRLADHPTEGQTQYFFVKYLDI
ncbi:GNAT family N-acetyltransferase [Exiguobacterium artemiae]|uniref:GNAT family N-acetyltransferase n=1 Tax=Exiguobacterium artemiae TaxID=340145 RepID=UPI003CFE98D4